MSCSKAAMLRSAGAGSVLVGRAPDALNACASLSGSIWSA